MNLQHPDLVPLRYGGDIRNLLLANRTFILQLAHPSVGAGVIQFSNFRSDPWSRLREIAYSGNQMMFHGHEAAVAEGKRLREMHRSIKGVDSRGKAYHALNPEVYGWVHFVFYESTLTTHQLFGTAADEVEQELLFQNWYNSGQYFGLRPKDLPATREAYWEKWHEMMANTLEYNEAIDYIIHLRQAIPINPPALSLMPKPLWTLLWKQMARYGELITVGSLPQTYRQKFSQQIAWGDVQQKRFATQQQRIKSIFNALPVRWRLMPEARHYLTTLDLEFAG